MNTLKIQCGEKVKKEAVKKRDTDTEKKNECKKNRDLTICVLKE